MAALQFAHQVDFEVYACCECGIQFGLTADFVRRRRGDNANWYCPRGHAQHFDAESEADRLRRFLSSERETSQRRLEALQAEQRSKAAFRGQLTKIKKRIGAGVCPCCNRTFADLARHIAGKHPDFTGTE